MALQWSAVVGSLLVPLLSAFLVAPFTQNVRMCMLSQASSLQSQCILCNQQKYNSAVNGCTRQNSLPPNITQEEAFCILAACIDNPRQTPVVLGKRKRREDEEGNVVDEYLTNVLFDDYEDVEDGDGD